MPDFIIVAAIAHNGVIGKDGQMPWRLPADMGRFKALTIGKTVLMGRKTFEDLPPAFRPMPGRTTIVMSRNPEFQPEGVQVIQNLTELDVEGEVWVLGGFEIYPLVMPYAKRLELTFIDLDITGDAFFPTINPFEWEEIYREHHEGDPSYDFVSYVRQNEAEVLEPEDDAPLLANAGE